VKEKIIPSKSWPKKFLSIYYCQGRAENPSVALEKTVGKVDFDMNRGYN